MTAQLDFFGGPTPPATRESPRERGHRLAKACLQAAQIRADFDSEGAGRFILGHLRAYGPKSGEDLTEAAKVHGYRPHDDRAFGGVFGRLSRKAQIRKVPGAECARRKGHGTAGGIVWEAVS